MEREINIMHSWKEFEMYIPRRVTMYSFNKKFYNTGLVSKYLGYSFYETATH